MVRCLFFFWAFVCSLQAEVQLGIDRFIQEPFLQEYTGKRIGLIANHTSVDSELRSTLDRLLEKKMKVVALFSPEHGWNGQAKAGETVSDGKIGNIPLYSLFGQRRRPTKEMLANVDVLIYDIQCIGTRSYTYSSTLFYAMEEAAKYHIEVVVLDRPNPINGLTIDGPFLESSLRSFIGYVNVPYCHGMTTGELALLFNGEYKVGCKLRVVPMSGWKRSMSYADTGLVWIPPSPHIPEVDTPLFYPSTGILGELELLSVGIGYTLPFKVVGAPWIDGPLFAAQLNKQKLAGVQFLPFCFRPFYGMYKGQDCQGVLIRVTDKLLYRPVSVQYLILGLLKSLYPQKVAEKLGKLKSKDMFHKANGSWEVFRILESERYPAWKLVNFQQEEREAFKQERKKYLLIEYPES